MAIPDMRWPAKQQATENWNVQSVYMTRATVLDAGRDIEELC